MHTSRSCSKVLRSYVNRLTLVNHPSSYLTRGDLLAPTDISLYGASRDARSYGHCFKNNLLSACANNDPSYDRAILSSRGRTMRILRSVVAAFIALNFLGWVTDAFAASDCPCKKIGPNVCIPDPDCAHRFRWRSNSY